MAATWHNIQLQLQEIIIKSLDPLKAKKTFIRKKLGHTTVSAIKVTINFWFRQALALVNRH